MKNRVLGGEGFVVEVELDQPLSDPLEGGNFFMLRTPDSSFPFLNRPFSVHDVEPDGRGPRLSFLLKVVGDGTACLAQLCSGQELRLVGPLGHYSRYSHDRRRRHRWIDIFRLPSN